MILKVIYIHCKSYSLPTLIVLTISKLFALFYCFKSLYINICFNNCVTKLGILHYILVYIKSQISKLFILAINLCLLKNSDVKFKAADTGVEYFKFPSDEWETVSIRDYPANFSVSEYRRRSGDNGLWEKKPSRTFNSGTTGFIVELRLKRYSGSPILLMYEGGQ